MLRSNFQSKLGLTSVLLYKFDRNYRRYLKIVRLRSYHSIITSWLDNYEHSRAAKTELRRNKKKNADFVHLAQNIKNKISHDLNTVE